jgi:hypothetical protein
MIRLPLITNSECTTSRRCAREHQIAYTLGIRPVASADPLFFGQAIHAALERRWNGGALFAPVEEYIDAYEREKAAAMLDGYAVRWEDDLERFEVIGVELQFVAPLVNPATGHASNAYRLGGKLDVLVRDRTRDYEEWIIEHKTTSEDIAPGSSYWARLRLDTQISMYMVGARALGTAPRGVIYDVLGKPMQRPSEVPIVDEVGVKIVLDANGERVRTKDGKKWRETSDAAQGYKLQTRLETPEEYGARIRLAIVEEPDAYFQRSEVVRLLDEEREAAADTWQIAARIRDARRTGVAPRNPDACVRWSRYCPYFPVCTNETTLDNPVRYRRVEHVHQELAAEEAATP